MFKDHKLNIVHVPTDRDGIVIEKLESLLLENQQRGRPNDERKWSGGLVYIIPTYNNPTGRSWSIERRRALAKLAHEKNLLVIADEVDLTSHNCC